MTAYNALELATALACRGRGFVADLVSWQIGRQRRALGLLLVGDRLRRAQLLNLVLNGRQIAVEFFFQQVALLGAVAFRPTGYFDRSSAQRVSTNVNRSASRSPTAAITTASTSRIAV